MTESRNRPNYVRTTIQGTAWRYLTFFSGRLLVLISTIILARLLTKDDFGVVGYAVTTITFLDVVSDFGVGSALIYHDDNEKAFNTAFWLGFLFSLILLSVAWFIAPLMAIFFQDDRVIPVTRALSLTFPINALGSTHAAVLRKRLDFGRAVFPEFMLASTKGVSSIVLALAGLGAWSLIWGQVIGAVISTITFWLISPWRPSIHFDRNFVRPLTAFGFNIMGVEIVSVLLLNVDYLLVGRYLGSEALGAYTLAFKLPDLLILQFARVLGYVIFPVFTHMRNRPGNLAHGLSQTLRYVSLITIPLGLGLALIARPLTLVFFTSKWTDAIPAIQGIAIYAMLLSLAYNVGDAYKAEGRPQIITWLSLFQLGLLLPGLWWVVNRAGSIGAVGAMHALVAFISVVATWLVAFRLLKIKLQTFIDALRPAIIAGSTMAVVVQGVLVLSSSVLPWQQLSIAILSGGITYCTVLWLFQRKVVLEVADQLRAVLVRGN